MTYMDKSHLKFLPISLNITHKKILLIGGGKIALQKVNSLKQFTDKITILSIDFIEELKKTVYDRIQKSYQKKDLYGFDIIYACTNDQELNAQIKRDGGCLGKLVNVVDNPLLCDFVSPALIKRDNITIAVGSNAQDVNQSIAVRNRILEFIDYCINNTSSDDSLSTINYKLSTNKVYLVGSGPGNPDLLTLKADMLLSKADIIFYDELGVSKEFLERYNGEKVYVGKRFEKQRTTDSHLERGQRGVSFQITNNEHCKSQDEINILLLEAAKKGKSVVRLKGGDPIIFAHAGEELEFLKENNIEVEIVPGVSSAIAAAAMSEIPLTYRDISSSVTFCTGHPEKSFYVPDSGTMVIFMGASNLKALVKKVIRKGWNEDTAIALIYKVSLPDESVKITTLKSILDSDEEFQSPLIVIIGEVVAKLRFEAVNVMS
jgi:uroporphyrin-III C-methyltransferase / precorrin-2 dehydrogenase / sirohydrochlorin ferrochelatase